MPALITHHIFGEDVACELPEGLVDGEEELLAFLLGNQGPDPFYARFSTTPSRSRDCHQFAHVMQGGRITQAFLQLREGVSRLPSEDEGVGRAFVLGVLGHYALDRAAHPFIICQQRAIVEADPSLKGSSREVHAVIESDLDSWILWEKRHATVRERPAATNLMRTDRIARVAGALYAQAALVVFGIALDPEEYGGAVRDYEWIYRKIDPARSPRTRLAGVVERTFREHSMAEAMAHYVVKDDECAAANLACDPWRNPFTGEVCQTGFADVFDQARLGYGELAEALVRGDEKQLRGLVGGLNYSGRPGMDD